MHDRYLETYSNGVLTYQAGQLYDTTTMCSSTTESMHLKDAPTKHASHYTHMSWCYVYANTVRGTQTKALGFQLPNC